MHTYKHAHTHKHTDIPGIKNEINLKKFWSFIKSKKKENSGVVPLMKKDKADILNMQFSSVFTNGNASNAPSLGVSAYSELPHITASVAGVRTLLEAIKPHRTRQDPS